MKNYKKLEKIFSRINDLKRVLELVQLDGYVNHLNNYKDRISQIITIKSIIHDIVISEELQLVISETCEETLDDWEKVNFNLMRTFCNTVISLPFELNVELTEKSILCAEYFKAAKKENNLKIVLEHFKNLIGVTRKVADFKLKDDENRYNQLLKVYQINSEQIDELCLSVGPFLKSKISDSNIDTSEVAQAKINMKKISDKLFFNDKLQVSFGDTSYVCGDENSIRIITREFGKTVLSNFMYLIGQAIYLQNLPYGKWRNQPICSPASLSMYSAQGFLFSHFFLEERQIMKILGVKDTKVFDTSIMGSNKFVALTHLMIKFSLEKSLINGEVDVMDLESAFKEDINYYFKDDSVSLLENEEWFLGKFCYYPCYLKGMIIAAQIFHMIKSDSNLWSANISNHGMKKIFNTLAKNIYNLGARYSTNELVSNFTGEELDCRFFKKFE
jgi:carboxypeptidase Taq